MAIAPHELKGVAAHVRHPHELERPRIELLLGALVKITHDVDFTLASRAGTMLAE